MKKMLTVFLSALMLLTMFVQPVFAGNLTSGDNILSGELIISLETSSISKSRQTDIIDAQEKALKSIGLDVLDSMAKSTAPKTKALYGTNGISEINEDILKDVGSVFLVKYDQKNYRTPSTAVNDIKEKLEKSGFKIKYIEPNMVLKATEEAFDNSNIMAVNNYPIHNSQLWHYNMINVSDAWDITTGSSNVKIAILDTGIDYNHPSLRNFVNTSLGRTYEGSSVYDGNGHGTHVAGTIASYGQVSGVMRNATLIPIKVLSDSGSGSTYNIQQGITYAAQIGADVINMSLGGGGYSQSMYNACQYAVNNGVVVVAASGNDGIGSVSYPAKYSNVIAVGSVNSNRQRSSFSQYGSGLNIMAPGNQIYSTYTGSRYATLSGTSMATPHVVGVVGLMRAANSNLTVAQIRNIISQTAQYAGSSNQYGSGIIDAAAAVSAAASYRAYIYPVFSNYAAIN